MRSGLQVRIYWLVGRKRLTILLVTTFLWVIVAMWSPLLFWSIRDIVFAIVKPIVKISCSVNKIAVIEYFPFPCRISFADLFRSLAFHQRLSIILIYKKTFSLIAGRIPKTFKVLLDDRLHRLGLIQFSA